MAGALLTGRARVSAPGGHGDFYECTPLNGYHRLPSSANSRAGVTGYSSMRTPNGASACSTAEMMAAAAGTQPASPTPLTPSGLSGEGNSTSVTSMRGTSVAPGSVYSAKVVVTGCASSS